jgi:hypothetical protein
MQDIHIDNEFLTSIKTSIEKMPKNNQLEVFRILKSNKSIKLNENKSGVFVNISFLSKEILQQLNEYIKYVQDQESVINNIETQKQEFKNTFLSNHVPKIVGTDEAFAMSASILDIQNEIAYPLEFPRLVHLKPMIQNWPWPADVVSNHVGFYFSPDGKLKIGNYQQTDLVHYNEKELMTDEIVSMLEEIAWKK